MIKDRLFKTLVHNCAGYKVLLKGESLEAGYRPDYVLVKNSNYLILESENSSNRKTFVGGLIKAAHFLRGENEGALIFIIVPKKNTTAKAIAKHLKRYLDWLHGITNLKSVYVIESKHYYDGQNVLTLLENNFISLAEKV